MKTILGLLGIIVGIVLGVYVGIWLMFIGGILGLVTAGSALLTGGGVMTGLIGWSILKIMFAGLIGYLSGAVIVFPSYVLMMSDN